jgi:site-specific DNA-methyltransferase (adenine-specific)
MLRIAQNKGEVPFYNLDCVEGARKHLKEGSVDLIVTDPPYGIGGGGLHKHYHRNEEFVVDGYIEVPEEEYGEFTLNWIREAERVLRPGGSLYIVSGYTHLLHILSALRETGLEEINHLIWKYSFGVYTKKKYVSSHYHILYYAKPGGERTFNTNCRFGATERNGGNGSLNYLDREDVWAIPREYKPGQKKNKNELPKELLKKIVQYSSDPGDLVCDFFLGGFSTAKVAIGLDRKACGFEKSREAFNHHLQETLKTKPGSLLAELRQPTQGSLSNQGERWTENQKADLVKRFDELRGERLNKKESISVLSKEMGRGYFSLLNALREAGR